MTKITFTNPLALKENDTLGTAVLKGLTEGYLKGMLASGLGLCALAVVNKAVSKKVKNSKSEEEEIVEDEELVEEVQSV